MVLRLLLATKNPAEDPATRLGLEDLLAEWHIAREPHELKDVLSKGAFDAVILCAGQGYGLEELQLIKTYAPDTPVIVLMNAEIEPLPDTTPHTVEYVSTSRLPDGLRYALNKLIERKRRWELLESVPVGLYRSTPDGRILEANSTLCAMLGYSREELLGLNARALYLEAAERESLIQQAIHSDLSVVSKLAVMRPGDSLCTGTT